MRADSRTAPVRPGVYFARVGAGAVTLEQKIVELR